MIGVSLGGKEHDFLLHAVEKQARRS